jgi:hypothetical protein
VNEKSGGLNMRMYAGNLPVGREIPGANRELMKEHPERVYALQGGLGSF